MRRAFLAFAAGFGLTGCWPAFKVVEPRANIYVIDASSTPIADAKVTAVVYVQPFGHGQVLSRPMTDANGAVHLRPDRHWVFQIALPDAVTSFSWGYCVEKAGYQAVTGPLEHSRKPLAIRLEPSAGKSRCAPPDDYGFLRVVDEE